MMKCDSWLLVAAYAVLAALALMFSCSPRAVKVVTASRDSSHIRTERIVDTFRTNTDNALLAALLECDSLGRVRIARMEAENGELVRQMLELQNNRLQVAAQARVQERWREVIRSDTVILREEVPVPYEVEHVKTEYRLRCWQRWLCWIGVFYLFRTLLRIASGWRNMTFKNLLKLF
ncbi:hypothetical protein [uncultured Rikenella sp.]|uniref:hypothetical protein n=1 Tax=uncultured Rikenella sp. TaxID=368003 RepID=UPI00272B5DF5|nr:hypothetical protein [uncultured Rikenella sp.]